MNDKRKESYESLKQLDREVDMYAQTAMKVKDRESRRELMDEVTDFKQKVQKVLEILRSALDSQLSNAIIA